MPAFLDEEEANSASIAMRDSGPEPITFTWLGLVSLTQPVNLVRHLVRTFSFFHLQYSAHIHASLKRDQITVLVPSFPFNSFHNKMFCMSEIYIISLNEMRLTNGSVLIAMGCTDPWLVILHPASRVIMRTVPKRPLGNTTKSMIFR